MLNLKELIDVGCAQTMVDSDGQIYPCSKPIVQSATGRITVKGTVTVASANSTPNRPV